MLRFDDWKLFTDLLHSVYLSPIFLSPKRTDYWLYQTKNGLKFMMRHGVWDSAMIIETWWLNEYSRYLNNLLKDKELIILDIGAHIGAFSLFIASQYQKIKVYAFEPHPENFQLLLENIQLNKMEQKILPFQLAIDQIVNPRKKMMIDTNNLSSPTIFKKNSYLSTKNIKETTWVSTTTLTEIFQKYHLAKCHFLKMDCEGCEFPSLLSVPQKILNKIEKIVVEYHCRKKIGKIRKQLKKNGFQVRIDRATPYRFIKWLVKVYLLFAWKKSV